MKIVGINKLYYSFVFFFSLKNNNNNFSTTTTKTFKIIDTYVFNMVIFCRKSETF